MLSSVRFSRNLNQALQGHSLSRDHPFLYEIHTVPWLLELSRQKDARITLGQVPEREWDHLAQLGFDYIWLMGVWQKSPEGRRFWRQAEETFSVYDAALPGWRPQDVIGSPYSIQAYQPDFEVGDWEELASVRRQLQRRGMGLILDFVPNHTGPDHPWVTANPHYYVQGTRQQFEARPNDFQAVSLNGTTLYLARGRDPFFDPWPDTLQLNYFVPEVRTAMIRVLKKLSRCCDGVRCDMSMLILNDIFSKTWPHLPQAVPEQEFWSEARSAVPDMIWLAEAYWDTEWSLQQLGFDYVYDKTLYDRIRFSTAPDLRLHLTADSAFQRGLLRFIENHDEARSAAEFDRNRLSAAATLLATLPGMRLFHHGQLQGRKTYLPVQLRRGCPEADDSSLENFYRRLLKLAGDDCFHSGQWQMLETRPIEDDSAANLIAYCWRSTREQRLVVVNFADQASQARIGLPQGINMECDYLLEDLLTNDCYRRSGRELSQQGLHVFLKAWQSHIFDLTPRLDPVRIK